MKISKKQQIELTAKELFWKHGFKKVSVEEVCKKAGVSRKTFYSFYDNKSTLVVFLLKEMTTEMMFAFNEIIDSDFSFAQKMEKMLALKYELSNQFSMEFVADFFHPDSEDILAYYTKTVQESLDLTKRFFNVAQQMGEMNPDLDVNFVMMMLQKMLEVCSTPDVMKLFPDAESMTRQISQFLIFGVMPVK